jgi:ankyrin repeat protein
MKPLRTLLIASLALCALPAAAAAAGDEDASAFGHALTLVQTFVRIAADAESPQASAKAIEDVLAGRNPEANRAAAGLLEEVTADMPAQYRDKVASIGRDLAALARRDAAARPLDPASAQRALQARKELTAMGLRYYDESQFLDAVKRGDVLAVERYIAGGGVDLSTRDTEGRSALDIARARGHDAVAGLLARNLPAAR